MIEIVKANHDLVEYISKNLRYADYVELSTSTGYTETPEEIVMKSFVGSDWCNVAIVDGIPTVVYGLYPTCEKDCGSPWMVATPGIKKISRQFIKGSRIAVDEMLKTYSTLFNYVHADNQLSISWLKWLGFTINQELVGPESKFHFFWMDKHV